MNVRFSNIAENDLQSIYDYIFQDNPQVAQRVIDRLIMAAYQLSDFPFLGRNGLIENTREWSVSGTPYFIVYTINQDSIHLDIETIIHSRKLYP